MEKVLIIGLGEVGSAIYRIIKESNRFKVYGYDINPSISKNSLESIEKQIDYLHIAIPYTHKFVEIVKNYVEMFNPRIVFIHSTVAIGTTRAVYNETSITTAYTPIRGKHPDMVKHIIFWNKWVSSIPIENVDNCGKHLSDCGFKIKIHRGSPETLELAKLWETVYRAVMIAAWQELHRIARKFDVDMETIVEFVGEVHEVLRDRPVYYPNYIGGHCLIPNTKILLQLYPSKLFEFVLESNENRLKELNNSEIRNEIEKIKTLTKKYINLDYYGGKID